MTPERHPPRNAANAPEDYEGNEHNYIRELEPDDTGQYVVVEYRKLVEGSPVRRINRREFLFGALAVAGASTAAVAAFEVKDTIESLLDDKNVEKTDYITRTHIVQDGEVLWDITEADYPWMSGPEIIEFYTNNITNLTAQADPERDESNLDDLRPGDELIIEGPPPATPPPATESD